MTNTNSTPLELSVHDVTALLIASAIFPLLFFFWVTVSIYYYRLDAANRHTLMAASGTEYQVKGGADGDEKDSNDPNSPKSSAPKRSLIYRFFATILITIFSFISKCYHAFIHEWHLLSVLIQQVTTWSLLFTSGVTWGRDLTNQILQIFLLNFSNVITNTNGNTNNNSDSNSSETNTIFLAVFWILFALYTIYLFIILLRNIILPYLFQIYNETPYAIEEILAIVLLDCLWLPSVKVFSNYLSCDININNSDNTYYFDNPTIQCWVSVSDSIVPSTFSIILLFILLPLILSRSLFYNKLDQRFVYHTKFLIFSSSAQYALIIVTALTGPSSPIIFCSLLLSTSLFILYLNFSLQPCMGNGRNVNHVRGGGYVVCIWGSIMGIVTIQVNNDSDGDGNTIWPLILFLVLSPFLYALFYYVSYKYSHYLDDKKIAELKASASSVNPLVKAKASNNLLGLTMGGDGVKKVMEDGGVLGQMMDMLRGKGKGGQQGGGDNNEKKEDGNSNDNFNKDINPNDNPRSPPTHHARNASFTTPVKRASIKGNLVLSPPNTDRSIGNVLPSQSQDVLIHIHGTTVSASTIVGDDNGEYHEGGESILVSPKGEGGGKKRVKGSTHNSENYSKSNIESMSKNGTGSVPSVNRTIVSPADGIVPYGGGAVFHDDSNVELTAMDNNNGNNNMDSKTNDPNEEKSNHQNNPLDNNQNTNDNSSPNRPPPSDDTSSASPPPSSSTDLPPEDEEIDEDEDDEEILARRAAVHTIRLNATLAFSNASTNSSYQQQIIQLDLLPTLKTLLVNMKTTNDQQDFEMRKASIQLLSNLSTGSDEIYCKSIWLSKGEKESGGSGNGNGSPRSSMNSADSMTFTSATKSFFPNNKDGNIASPPASPPQATTSLLSSSPSSPPSSPTELPPSSSSFVGTLLTQLSSSSSPYSKDPDYSLPAARLILNCVRTKGSDNHQLMQQMLIDHKYNLSLLLLLLGKHYNRPLQLVVGDIIIELLLKSEYFTNKIYEIGILSHPKYIIKMKKSKYIQILSKADDIIKLLPKDSAIEIKLPEKLKKKDNTVVEVPKEEYKILMDNLNDMNRIKSELLLLNDQVIADGKVMEDMKIQLSNMREIENQIQNIKEKKEKVEREKEILLQEMEKIVREKKESVMIVEKEKENIEEKMEKMREEKRIIEREKENVEMEKVKEEKKYEDMMKLYEEKKGEMEIIKEKIQKEEEEKKEKEVQIVKLQENNKTIQTELGESKNIILSLHSAMSEEKTKREEKEVVQRKVMEDTNRQIHDLQSENKEIMEENSTVKKENERLLLSIKNTPAPVVVEDNSGKLSQLEKSHKSLNEKYQSLLDKYQALVAKSKETKGWK